VKVGIEKKIPILMTGGHMQHVSAEVGSFRPLIQSLAERVWKAGLPVIDDLVTQPTNARDYEGRRQQLLKLLAEMKRGSRQIIVHCTARPRSSPTFPGRAGPRGGAASDARPRGPRIPPEPRHRPDQLAGAQAAPGCVPG